MTREPVPDVPGAEVVASWFGRWPSFHDAEVLLLHLNRHGSSRLSIHAWNISDQTYEDGGQVFFVREKNAVVTFELEGITALELGDFNEQNVLSGLDIDHDGNVYRLSLHPCYGFGGRLEAARVSVTLRPGKPSPRETL